MLDLVKTLFYFYNHYASFVFLCRGIAIYPYQVFCGLLPANSPLMKQLLASYVCRACKSVQRLGEFSMIQRALIAVCGIGCLATLASLARSLIVSL
jgi:hypothetical protein